MSVDYCANIVYGHPCQYLTLTTKKEAIHKVWFVMNQFKVKKAFKDGEEALKYAEEINKPILDALK